MRSTPRPLLASAAALAALIAGCSAAPAPAGVPSGSTPAASAPSAGSPSAATSATASARPTASGTLPGVTEPAPDGLPRGGTQLFPAYRLFGYVGYPGDKILGRLGVGDIEARMAELEQQGASYTAGRTVLPVMELIATTVHAEPGADGTFRTRAPDSVIADWLDVARRHKALLLLDIQPGRADFLSEVKHLEKWLREPDVGVALDPEWAVDAGQIPGKVFGNTTGAELDGVAEYLSQLVQDNGLPEKVMVYHVLHPPIVKNEAALQRHPGVVLVKSADGIGSPAQKIDQWKRVVAATKADVHMGFKLFFTEDPKRGGRLMTTEEVLGLEPQPEYVMFE